MELPSIGSTNYQAALTASNQAGLLSMQQLGQIGQWEPNNLKALAQTVLANHTPTITKQEPPMAEFNTRLVKVFIVDPNVNLPLDNRLLFRGDEKLTDLTDQELFFEIDLNGLLAKHNEIRVKTEDKKANKDKPVYLEAARVRDLKMQVVVLAQF